MCVCVCVFVCVQCQLLLITVCCVTIPGAVDRKTLTNVAYSNIGKSIFQNALCIIYGLILASQLL